jgi:hypothetical protein
MVPLDPPTPYPLCEFVQINYYDREESHLHSKEYAFVEFSFFILSTFCILCEIHSCLHVLLFIEFWIYSVYGKFYLKIVSYASLTVDAENPRKYSYIDPPNYMLRKSAQSCSPARQPCTDFGRLIDLFKVTLNGSEVLNVNFRFSSLFILRTCPTGGPNGTSAWPRDIPIRRNMSSSGWFDLYNGILSNEVFIFDEKGPVPKDKIEEFFRQGKGKMILHATYRRAVVISDDQKMILGVYAHPASLTHLDGNPKINR